MKIRMSHSKTSMRSECCFVATLLLILTFFPPNLSAQVPLAFDYQGRLIDAQGMPITGAVTGHFKIYKGGTDMEVPSSGIKVYEETTTLAADANGVFRHRIGVGTVLDHAGFTAGDQPRFVELSIDRPGGTEVLLPRRQAISVPYALKAMGVVPVGAVLSWWGTLANLPVGFEICDGGFPTTPGATLVGRKPNLTDRLVKGAEPSDSVRASLSGGGSDSTEHAHDHSHTHGMNGHNHGMSHTHDTSSLRAAIYFDSANSGESFWLKESGTDIPGIVQHHVFAQGTPTLVQSTSGYRYGAQTQTVQVYGNTHASSAAFTGGASGPSADASTLSTSGAVLDNRPAFQELFYIIRVK